MPTKKGIFNSSLHWLSRAKGDLAIAKAPLPEGAFFEDLCFHAQQAAEKAIKAVYLHQELIFQYTHDLDELITCLKRSGTNIPLEVEEATILTGYASESRYPGLVEPVTEEEYLEALNLAEKVIAWAEKQIKG